MSSGSWWHQASYLLKGFSWRVRWNSMNYISSYIKILGREIRIHQKCKASPWMTAPAGSQRMACRGPFGDRWAAKQPLGVEGSAPWKETGKGARLSGIDFWHLFFCAIITDKRSDKTLERLTGFAWSLCSTVEWIHLTGMASWVLGSEWFEANYRKNTNGLHKANFLHTSCYVVLIQGKMRRPGNWFDSLQDYREDAQRFVRSSLGAL